MSTNRPFVLSIAGFDPSAGAGVLADIKTFEQHKVYGLAINTANTIQTEDKFVAIKWTTIEFVLQSIKTLFDSYEIKAVKIGIIPSLQYLKSIIFLIKKLSPKTKIIWDTVLKSTTEFNFLNIQNQNNLIAVLEKTDLITPNYNEILKLSSEEKDADFIAAELSVYCAVLLKGGHRQEEIGVDYLYLKNEFIKLSTDENSLPKKHGSGCILSSAVTANLALGQDLTTSCRYAKRYVENYLKSTYNLIGYHYE
ncbi:hydroxymethylpyrimidine/phosphomethylpyrimidine kinase [Flavobacterium sp. ST-87]|uniref:hydroxymethylpyrimidine kinase n=1 Tax=Flavobacterium plantiphilum TaxID=3163297 RepID=A0ABW8XT99_9FLAO